MPNEKKKKLIVDQKIIFVPCDPLNHMRGEHEEVRVVKSGLKKIKFEKEDGEIHECNLNNDNSFHLSVCIENWRIVGHLYESLEDYIAQIEFEKTMTYDNLSALSVEEKKQVMAIVKNLIENKKGKKNGNW